MMNVFARSILLSAALLAVAPEIRGQSMENLAAGTRVRVAAPATGRVVGTVTEVRGDTLLVTSRRGVHALPASSIRSLQVSRGRSPRLTSALQGGAIGLATGVVGGVAGALIADLTIPDDACDSGETDLLCFSTGESALLGVIVGAPFGAASGAVLGLVFPRERWRSVTARGAPALTVQPQAAGVRVGLSLTTP